MRKKYWIALALLFIIPGLLFTTSCAKKTVKSEPAAKAPAATDEAAKKAELEKQKAELARQKALEEQRLDQERLAKADAEAKKKTEQGKRVRFEQEHIYFDFDKYNLKPEAQSVLKMKAEFMKANPNIKARIEGHCDERGTNEYNLALGDRRANSAKEFLLNLGIDESRLTTISHGEERPIDKGKNEAAWAKNRRAQFVVW
ncbi:MAG TPA: peptidoglycan-associated lipoprotein Pal [Deltaproteobacteria bacterium]|nr:peptidoglycan-associated lipoprotein Pal [Deltaproteobacteria bacterium]